MLPRLLPIELICACLVPTALATPQQVAAQAEMATLAEGLTQCAVDTSWYVSLETLNDVAAANLEPHYDSLNDAGGVWVLRPGRGLFHPARRDLASGVLRWRGPYVNFQSGRTQTGPEPYDLGSPLDPWGRPYLLFSPLGLVRGDEGTVTQEYYGDAFDRYTIVTLGFDGVMSEDDQFHAFGAGITDFVISSARAVDELKAEGDALPAGGVIRIRGYNLGISPEDGQVVLGDRVLTDVSSWTPVAVEVAIPADVRGPAPLFLRRGALETNRIEVQIAGPNAARGWTCYP
ncbi:MAG TPA: hypothetical protein PK847_12675 [Candidatus Sumerlaeota bacterium]|nr:hypothetical protein [Candidatus Sumerlaeota bacterium]HOR26758.1 hypothetical protein [Candidatus Sumerlaeota bacterium]